MGLGWYKAMRGCVRLCMAMRGCARLCIVAMWGCARLCVAMQGCVRLCVAMRGCASCFVSLRYRELSHLQVALYFVWVLIENFGYLYSKHNPSLTSAGNWSQPSSVARVIWPINVFWELITKLEGRSKIKKILRRAKKNVRIKIIGPVKKFSVLVHFQFILG